jgi:putative ATP-dependent endonuclease of the OLD family
MKLVSFSVTNYRSITTAYKLPIGQSTVLIGPNNEGKSNILRALVTALGVLSNLSRIRIMKGRFRSDYLMSGAYDWKKDYPVTLQEKNPSGESIFNIEFEFTDKEIDEFVTEIKSRLNGTLSIQLTIGQKNPGFRVLKKGPGAATLTGKAEAIAQFVAKRIDINHIPAVRTASSAHRVVNEIVEKELSAVEGSDTFQAALAEVAKAQAPVLDQISRSIEETLREFLPNVKKVQVTISQEDRYRALRRSCEIVVDDGTPTLLAHKGDGVQSLAALSLLRHSSEAGASGRNLILAIEEPESHLHPSAIHQLKTVLAEIASKNQVIMTTHCPLFVNRASIRSNILVHKNKAAPAKNVKQIRDIQGVRASDNLQHAELVLLVEGEEDRRAIEALLKHYSPELASAITQGTLGFDSLMGGSNLSYKLSQVREAMCSAHCLLDNDRCGIEAARQAELNGLLTSADSTFTICEGMKESEIEDLYDETLYAPMLQYKHGASTASPKFKGGGKWSDRLRETFRHQGKQWDDQVEAKVKTDVAELVQANPAAALNPHKRSAFNALVGALTSKIKTIAISKK